MNEYDIIITPEAEDDLDRLFAYIALELKAPETAFNYVHDIRSEFSTLSRMPKRFRIVDDEPWHSRGLRRMNARNFAAFFIVIEQEGTVFIQNVIYQKRDLPKVLSELYRDLGEL